MGFIHPFNLTIHCSLIYISKGGGANLARLDPNDTLFFHFSSQFLMMNKVVKIQTLPTSMTLGNCIGIYLCNTISQSLQCLRLCCLQNSEKCTFWIVTNGWTAGILYNWIHHCTKRNGTKPINQYFTNHYRTYILQIQEGVI